MQKYPMSQIKPVVRSSRTMLDRRHQIHLAHFDLETTAFGPVSSPGELHPEALAEPSVNLSIHWAPIIQPEKAQLKASEQTDSDYI